MRGKCEKGLTGHQFCEMSERFAENHVTMLRNALLELLLQETAAVLILAKTCNLALKFLEARTSKAVDYAMTYKSIHHSRTKNT